MNICLFIGAFICFLAFLGNNLDRNLNGSVLFFSMMGNVFLVVIMVLAGLAMTS